MPDNRLRLPPTKISFGNNISDDAPTVNQDHDDFPEPGQARYDHMRMYLIALLAHQSSEFSDMPSEGRTGSIWFPSDLGFFFYTDDNANTWKTIADAVGLTIDESDPTDGEHLSLSEWFAEAQPKLEGLRPKMTWSGHAANSGLVSIPVPESLQDILTPIKDDVRPLVYINGALVDPRNCNFSGCADVVELSGNVELSKNDDFTVIVEKFDNFITDEIVASG